MFPSHDHFVGEEYKGIGGEGRQNVYVWKGRDKNGKPIVDELYTGKNTVIGKQGETRLGFTRQLHADKQGSKSSELFNDVDFNAIVPYSKIQRLSDRLLYEEGLSRKDKENLIDELMTEEDAINREKLFNAIYETKREFLNKAKNKQDWINRYTYLARLGKAGTGIVTGKQLFSIYSIFFSH